jgi:hypothetical protein
MRNSRIVLVVFFTLAVVVLAPALALGQATIGVGTITGQVTDQTGGVIIGAQVTATDTATGISQEQPTNQAGRFVFTNVKPSTYDVTVTMKGFRKLSVVGQVVVVGGQVNLNLTLEVGAATQTVEVRAAPGAQLQTLNATMGQTVNAGIVGFPSIGRDITAVLNFVPTAAPSFGGAESDYTAGGVAGRTSDQNTYTLDGGIDTDDLAGNSGYVNNFSGTGRGAMPTPMESIQEFTVNTNNTTADFGTSSGAQMLLTTKRGTNSFHGSAYDFHQNSALNSNSWDNNFHGDPKPVNHSNRFGFSAGGPMLPRVLGGKTYFYYNYEGNRYPRAGPIERLVPSDLLRQGILQFPGGLSYNLGSVNPVVGGIWSKYEPEPNDNKFGDRLNTLGYRANLSYPLKDGFMVGRVDHDFGSKWRWFTSYRWYRENNPNTSQIDIGGLLPGDTKGVPAAASRNVLQPRYFVTGLTGSLTPAVTNEFHFNYVRNNWQWIRAGAYPQDPNIPAAVEIGGQKYTVALMPMNADTQNSRPRLWTGHDWNYRDTLSWLKGNHFFQFGGELYHQWLHFDRYDNVIGGLTQPGYEVSSVGIDMGSVIPSDLPSAYTTSFESLYAMVNGFVSRASVVATRTGKDLKLNPIGTPMRSYDIVDSYHLYFNDSWHIRPNLTVSYGLNWGVQQPPYEVNGNQMLMVDANNKPISVADYLNSFKAAALNGDAYAPTLEWTTIGSAAGNRKYPYDTFYSGFGPRVSVAWSPTFNSGWLASVFGHKSTVVRGGYTRVYDRQFPIDFISSTVLAPGFLQSVACENPDRSQVCGNGTTPATAFRIGVDGNSLPLTPSQTLPLPVEPGINTDYAVLAESMDAKYRPAVSDQLDFSIQRELKGNMVLEVGWLGVWSNHVESGTDLGSVPYMMKLGGQSFAEAYRNLYSALSSGQAVTPQPFFETALAGTSYCGGYASCSAAVAANEGSNILTQMVTTLWSDLDSSWNFGSVLPSTTQCYYCFPTTDFGYGNYQALIVSLQKRPSHGLTLNGNFTYSHALGTYNMSQTYTLQNFSDVWNPRVDYGPQYYDRKFVANILGSYELPFGKGRRWGGSNPFLSRLLGGWAVSPVFSFGSGLPLILYNQDPDFNDCGCTQDFGQAWEGLNTAAVPLINTAQLSNSIHKGVIASSSVGANGNPENGGPGLNLFADPAQVYSGFRPPMLGLDERSRGTGQLRGLPRWNLDLGITKDTRITERVGLQFFAQAFNLFNNPQFSNPYLALQDPGDFGVPYNPLTGVYQYNVLNDNYTRVIQLGLRLRF